MALIRTEIFHCNIQQFQASMQGLWIRLGTKGWLSSGNVRIMFGEYPWTDGVYGNILIPGGYIMQGTYKRRDDCEEMVDAVKRSPKCASWEVTPWNSSSMRSWWHPQKGRYLAGIEAYEVADKRTRVDFFDGYSPSKPQQEYLPIGSPFEEFCQMIVEEILEYQDETNMTSTKILFLAAGPTDASRLRLGEEFREIKEKLKLSKLRRRFSLELPQFSVRPEDISQALLDIQPQIVHFSGHGTSTGALCFENQTGKIQLIKPDALAALFEQFSNQVNCVLLNACYSEVQAKAIAEHIEYVIGMNKAIGDVNLTILIPIEPYKLHTP